MKHSDRSTYNIYSGSSGVRRRRNSNRRKTFVIVCLLLCMTCTVLDAIFITKLIKHSKKKSEPTETTIADTNTEAIMTDESGNPISVETSDPSDTSIVPETTPTRVQTVDAATRTANLEALKGKITDYLGQQSGRYSMYYINMNNGESIGVNENAPIVAASSIKIAYNTYLYEKVESGELSMDEKMKYNAAPYPDGDLETGTGTIQNSADGTEFSLQEVSHLSITISDNCGTNMVLRRLGGVDAVNNNYLKSISSIVDYLEKVQYTDYTGKVSEGRRRTSSIDLAKYAEHTYQDWTRNQELYQPLIDDLCNTEYNWGVPQGVPASVKVAHKVGFNPDYDTNNDIAIVFGTEDYVLCVMTESGDEQKAHNIIGEVSRMVYEYVESNYA